jgi:hypothetical protein
MAQRSKARRTIRLTTALLLAGTLGAVGATSASAGPQHHGTDPAASGCNQNAAQISSHGIETPTGQVVATVQVFYSYSCQTNWIRITGNPAGGAAIKNIRTQGGAALASEVDYGTGSSYSMQVYAPGSTCIEYQAILRYPGGAHYAEAYDPSRSWILVC